MLPTSDSSVRRLLNRLFTLLLLVVWRMNLQVRRMSLIYQLINKKRRQKKSKSHHITHPKDKAPLAPVTEITARGLFQNHQKSLLRESLQKILLPHTSEVDIQITEVHVTSLFTCFCIVVIKTFFELFVSVYGCIAFFVF